jgi:hypothetical protein
MGVQELACGSAECCSRPAFSGVYVLPHCKGQATHPKGHIHSLSSLQYADYGHNSSLFSVGFHDTSGPQYEVESNMYAPRTTDHILIALRCGAFGLAARILFSGLQEGVSLAKR